MEPVQQHAHSAAGPQQSEKSDSEGGMSMSPPAFGLSASSAGDAPIQAFGGILDGIGDALNIRDDEAAKDLQEDIDAFEGQDYGPMTYTNPESSGSGFETSYHPGAKRMDVEIRGKIRFADGLVDNGGTISSTNTFMERTQLVTLLNTYPALQAQILPFYQWGGDEKEIHKVRFMENVKAAMSLWNNAGHTFQVSDAGWESVTATPNINVDIKEGEAVTNTERGGFLWLDTNVVEGTSDHVQIEMVKKPSSGDAGQINTLVTNFLTNQAAAVTETGMLGNILRAGILGQQPPNSDARGVRSYLGNDKGDRGSNNPAGHNNFMSIASDRSDDPNQAVYTQTVYFKSGTAEITNQASFDAFLANPAVLLQNPPRSGGNVTIDLEGYSRGSGTTPDNTALVDLRLAEVANQLNAQMDAESTNIKSHVVPAAETNHADGPAEADAGRPGFHVPGVWDKVEIEVTQSGRGGQNVLAHELGHNFGLGDEYASGSRPAGDLAHHDDEAKNAGLPGGSVVASDNTRMMESGNDVQPVHYSTFADALNQLTGKTWNII